MRARVRVRVRVKVRVKIKVRVRVRARANSNPKPRPPPGLSKATLQRVGRTLRGGSASLGLGYGSAYGVIGL